MPKNSGQKMKLIYILDILNKYSDENHQISMSEIIDKLNGYGISAERKSIYSDIDLLRTFGIDIICEKTDKFRYYIGSRDFELAELKLLVDSVHASRFITEKKSNILIKKLEKLTSFENAKELNRQVYISDKVKTMNETSFYSVDILHEAISKNKKVSFKYFKYNINIEKEYRNNGNAYIVSPYSLTYSDENYYLISYYEKHKDRLTHFRVDRMTNIEILNNDIDKLSNVMPKNFDIAKYSKNIFNMFSGETEKITVACDNLIINQIIDRFGKNVHLRKKDANSFFAEFDAIISPTFFGWVFTFEGKMKIVSPQKVIDNFNKTLDSF